MSTMTYDRLLYNLMNVQSLFKRNDQYHLKVTRVKLVQQPFQVYLSFSGMSSIPFTVL